MRTSPASYTDGNRGGIYVLRFDSDVLPPLIDVTVITNTVPRGWFGPPAVTEESITFGPDFLRLELGLVTWAQGML